MASNRDKADEASLSSPDQWGMAARNFLIGGLLGGVPVLAYLWLSVDMTYGSWAAVGTGRLLGAIAVPILCGLLTASFGQRAIRVLSDMVESANLPF
ncbi:MAG: hypothetical protein AAF609_23960 [Cyanobacteria bacterium P01_C01_bin.120]